MCDFGSALSDPDFSIVNLLGPSLPCRSLNPLTGIREVPVANCSSRDFCSASQLRMHYRSPSVLIYVWIKHDEEPYRPEMSNDLILLGVASVVSVFLPILHVNICNASN